MIERWYYKLGERAEECRPLKIKQLLYIEKSSIFRGTDI